MFVSLPKCLKCMPPFLVSGKFWETFQKFPMKTTEDTRDWFLVSWRHEALSVWWPLTVMHSVNALQPRITTAAHRLQTAWPHLPLKPPHSVEDTVSECCCNTLCSDIHTTTSGPLYCSSTPATHQDTQVYTQRLRAGNNPQPVNCLFPTYH